MDFKKYLSATEKVFKFRIKTLFPLVEETMDLLEKALQKYRPVSITDPVKTMYQTNPLGFTGVKSGEVYITDVEITIPTTATLLQFDLRGILGLNKDDNRLMVFDDHAPEENIDNEPYHTVETDDRGKVTKKGALLNNEKFEEVTEASFDDYYGAEYNKKFLAYLKEVEAERKEKTKAGNLDAKHPITRWEKQPKPGSDLSPEQGKE